MDLSLLSKAVKYQLILYILLFFIIKVIIQILLCTVAESKPVTDPAGCQNRPVSYEPQGNVVNKEKTEGFNIHISGFQCFLCFSLCCRLESNLETLSSWS